MIETHIDSEGRLIIGDRILRVRATRVGRKGQARTITREGLRNKAARRRAQERMKWSSEPTEGSTTFVPRKSIVAAEGEHDNNPEGRKATALFEEWNRTN